MMMVVGLLGAAIAAAAVFSLGRPKGFVAGVLICLE